MKQPDAGPSAAARAMRDSDLWPGAFDEAPEAERNVWLHRAAAALPMLRAELWDETIRECQSALRRSAEKMLARCQPDSIFNRRTGEDAYLIAAHAVQVLGALLDPDPTPPEVAP